MTLKWLLTALGVCLALHVLAKPALQIPSAQFGGPQGLVEKTLDQTIFLDAPTHEFGTVLTTLVIDIRYVDIAFTNGVDTVYASDIGPASSLSGIRNSYYGYDYTLSPASLLTTSPAYSGASAIGTISFEWDNPLLRYIKLGFIKPSTPYYAQQNGDLFTSGDGTKLKLLINTDAIYYGTDGGYRIQSIPGDTRVYVHDRMNFNPSSRINMEADLLGGSFTIVPEPSAIVPLASAAMFLLGKRFRTKR